MQDQPGPQPKPAAGFARKLPILVILLAAAIGAVALRDQLSFEALAENRQSLLAFRDDHYFWAALAFMAAYVGIVAFSLPGGTIATLTGGFLFGLFPGVVFNVVSATTGAFAVFMAARAGFGTAIAERIETQGGAAARLQAALRENEWSALLIMRLVPVVPFFVANLLPALVGSRISRFVLTTFFGIMPGTFVFTWIGAGLGDVFAKGGKPDLSIIFSPQVLGPLLGLAALSALPIVLKQFRKGA